mgnify:CR=1 FL=1
MMDRDRYLLVNLGIVAQGDDWWSKMSPTEQQQYVKDHPGTKKKPTGPGKEPSDIQPAEPIPGQSTIPKAPVTLSSGKVPLSADTVGSALKEFNDSLEGTGFVVSMSDMQVKDLTQSLSRADSKKWVERFVESYVWPADIKSFKSPDFDMGKLDKTRKDLAQKMVNELDLPALKSKPKPRKPPRIPKATVDRIKNELPKVTYSYDQHAAVHDILSEELGNPEADPEEQADKFEQMTLDLEEAYGGEGLPDLMKKGVRFTVL